MWLLPCLCLAVVATCSLLLVPWYISLLGVICGCPVVGAPALVVHPLLWIPFSWSAWDLLLCVLPSSAPILVVGPRFVVLGGCLAVAVCAPVSGLPLWCSRVGACSAPLPRCVHPFPTQSLLHPPSSLCPPVGILSPVLCHYRRCCDGLLLWCFVRDWQFRSYLFVSSVPANFPSLLLVSPRSYLHRRLLSLQREGLCTFCEGEGVAWGVGVLIGSSLCCCVVAGQFFMLPCSANTFLFVVRCAFLMAAGNVRRWVALSDSACSFVPEADWF